MAHCRIDTVSIKFVMITVSVSDFIDQRSISVESSRILPDSITKLISVLPTISFPSLSNLILFQHRTPSSVRGMDTDDSSDEEIAEVEEMDRAAPVPPPQVARVCKDYGRGGVKVNTE